MEVEVVQMTQKSSLTDIKEIVRLSYLYDFYGPLLKDRHREIFEQYILNDLSLSEIAQKYDITRQGVYDIVKRGSRKLEEYEEKLQLFQRFQMAKERLGKIEELVKTDQETEKEELLALAREIYEIL
jgi:Uncharacterized protein conserved in bacteria